MSVDSTAVLRSAEFGRAHRGAWVLRVVLGLLAVAALVVLVLRAPSAAEDFKAAFARVSPGRSLWLVAAGAAELVALVFYAWAQARLLGAGPGGVSGRTVFGLATAAAGLTALLPGGGLPAGGWLAGQYRRRGVPLSLAAWSVLAGGFASTVTMLALLLIGAGVAQVTSTTGLVLAAVVLVFGSAGFVAAVHRLVALEGWLTVHMRRQRGPLARLVHRGSTLATDLVGWRVGVRGGTVVLVASFANWLADGACLAAVFGLLGLPVPWTGLLYGFILSQVAGSVVPTPGGVGAVEGGLVGGLTLTGTPVGEALAAAVVYRVIAYWGVGAVGTTVLLAMSRPRRVTDDRLGTADGERLGWRHVEGPVGGELAVVVVPGFTGSLRKAYLRRVINAFARHAAVIAIEPRGHGWSTGKSALGYAEATDVAAAVDRAHELGYRQVVTVGFSMGGVAVLRYAAAAHDVDGVVAVSAPSDWSHPGSGRAWLLQWLVTHRSGRLLLRLVFRTRVAGDLAPAADAEPLAVAARIAPTPLLLVYGGQDRYVPPWHAYALAAVAGPTTELLLFPRAGHAEVGLTPPMLERVAERLPALARQSQCDRHVDTQVSEPAPAA